MRKDGGPYARRTGSTAGSGDYPLIVGEKITKRCLYKFTPHNWGVMFNKTQRGSIMTHTILRLPAVKAETGNSRSTHYLRIAQGLFTKPVSLGPRAVGWPSSEVAALNAAPPRLMTSDFGSSNQSSPMFCTKPSATATHCRLHCVTHGMASVSGQRPRPHDYGRVTRISRSAQLSRRRSCSGWWNRANYPTDLPTAS